MALFSGGRLCFNRKDVGNYSTCREVRTWRISVQVMAMMRLAARHTRRTQPTVTVWCGEVGTCDARVLTICV